MTEDIDNVAMEETGFHPLVLDTSGVDTCVAAVVSLRGDGVVVIAYVDPTKIFSNSPSMDVTARHLIEHCIEQLNKSKPGAVIDAVYLIGGRDSSSYRGVSGWIDHFRTSVSVNAQSDQASTGQLHEFLSKIKLNLLTFNIRRQRAMSNDGEEEDEDLNGTATLTSILAIYKVNVASARMSAYAYSPLYRSPFGSLVVETIRRNGIDRSSILHRGFDLPADDADYICLRTS